MTAQVNFISEMLKVAASLHIVLVAFQLNEQRPPRDMMEKVCSGCMAVCCQKLFFVKPEIIPDLCSVGELLLTERSKVSDM